MNTYVGTSDRYLLCYLDELAYTVPDPVFTGSREEVIEHLVSLDELYGNLGNYTVDREKCKCYYSLRFRYVDKHSEYRIIPSYDPETDSETSPYTGWIIYRL